MTKEQSINMDSVNIRQMGILQISMIVLFFLVAFFPFAVPSLKSEYGTSVFAIQTK